MSDLENVDVMLGSYSKKELESKSGERNDERDFGSDRTRQDVVQISEDFRSLLNSNSGENSESTIEMMRLVNSEVSKKIDELKRDLNTQIVDTIISVISKKNPSEYSKYKDQSKSCDSGRSGPHVQETEQDHRREKS